MRARRAIALASAGAALVLAQACGSDPSAGDASTAASAGEVGVAGGVGEGGGADPFGGMAGTPEGGSGVVGPSGGVAGEETTAGAAGADDCDGQPARALALRGINVLQAVDVPIMEQLVALQSRRTDVVSGRAALLRAFITPGAAWRPRQVRARLTLGEPTGDPLILEQAATVTTASSEAELDSTFNFVLPATAITEATRYSLELLESGSCDVPGDSEGARFPERGMTPLGAVRVGSLRVRLVAVEVPREGVPLVPDTSSERLQALRERVMQLFPIEGIELSVREQPLSSDATDMLELLDEVAAVRDVENDDPGLTYYGLVRFGERLSDYCAPSCVLGASFTGEVPRGGGVAVGVGYADEATVTAFAHELGHVYGRAHSPCNVAGDPDFPYSGGRIGSLGYDLFSGALVDPAQHFDFMGYCSPSWVSDYVYQRLSEFIGAVNTASPEGLARRELGNPREYRTLIVPNGRPPRWGRSRVARRLPGGTPEIASVLDASGRVLEKRLVRRFKVADLDAEIVYVPGAPASSWASLRFTGRSDLPLPIERKP